MTLRAVGHVRSTDGSRPGFTPFWWCTGLSPHGCKR